MDTGIALLNAAPCGIFSFTADGTIGFVNDTLLHQLEYSLEELKGQHVEKILTISSRIFYQTHFYPLLTLHGRAEEIFLTLQSKSKTAIPVLVNANQQKENGEEMNVCACIIVLQRKKYEDEILKTKKTAEEALHKNELLQQIQHELENKKQELDNQLTSFRYMTEELLQITELVTHDLQEPVRKIGTYVDLLKNSEEFDYDERALKSFEIIDRAVDRIRLLLLSLQDYLPILTGSVNKSEIDLDTLVNDELANIRTENPEVEFEVTKESLPTIRAAAGQMKILFHNLLMNCIKFRKHDEKLHIKITSSLIKENMYYSSEGKYKYEEFVQVTIEDNGIGFDPAYHELIFKMLKSLDYKKKNLGLGLTFCKRIVENHMGIIKATAEEGKGATFTITLPVA